MGALILVGAVVLLFILAVGLYTISQWLIGRIDGK